MLFFFRKALYRTQSARFLAKQSIFQIRMKSNSFSSATRLSEIARSM